MSGEIPGEKDLVSGSDGHQEKHALAQNEPESETSGQKQNALHFAQGENRLPAIENPHRNQIQKIQSGASARQGSPQRVSRLPPQDGAGDRGQKPGQWPGKADRRAGLERDSKSLPTHVGPKAGKENGMSAGSPRRLTSMKWPIS